jgi:predicted hotdog family 3-hydroxylacyl-ACP dehydratase
MDKEYTVAELVPHSGNMSLLDEIIDYGDEWLHARVRITEKSLFMDERGVPALVGIEYLAQTVAAYAGLQERNHGGKPKLGFLLGARKYQCSTDYFSIGDTLELHVELEMQADNGLNVFQCSLKGNNSEASARLNVFQPDDADEFLQGAL